VVTTPPSEITTPRDAFHYFESFTNLEKMRLTEGQRRFRLDRMHILLRIFGDPQESFRSLHIAGTKGKGSTAVMIASVLEAAGLSTGLYTSPHVSSYLERILLSLRFPPPEMIVRVARSIRRTIESLPRPLPGNFPPTTFELLTLTAFLLFQQAGCRYAVVETGIGGRLDATNVLSPLACLLTPLDLEHTELLGPSLEAIAQEKGGIIKPGVPVFCGFQAPEVRRIFSRIAVERGAPCAFLDEEVEHLQSRVSDSGTRLTITLRGGGPDSFGLRLPGRFQAENAALAALAITRVFPDIPRSALDTGFRRAFLPGRLEIIHGSPPIVLDGAHTPLAARRLLESYREIYPRRGVLLFGSVSGKDPHTMADILAPHFRHVIVSRPGTFKESKPREVFEHFARVSPETHLVEEAAEALAKARSLAGPSLPILVTGSFYMIAEIRRQLVAPADSPLDPRA